MTDQRLIAGIDVGGTFTDLVLVDAEVGTVRVAKVATTPDNQALGVLAAIDEVAVDPAEIGVIVHGTTTTTNALLERKVARTGLITTAGFRDILELGRRTRPAPYGMHGRFEPLIPRELRLEVEERLDYRGRVLVPLDERGVAEAAQRLLEQGCEAVVIHFLHAYANPAHEQRAGEIVRGLWPNPYVTLGHALLSEYREFERGTTAAVNACVQPVLDRYLARLRLELEAREFAGDLLVMQGNGGTIAARIAAEEAAKTVMSGPASGVMAAAWGASLAGVADLVTYDMGGTSTDVALIRGGLPAVSDELELEYAMPIHVPMVNVRTIGAGGGSIAWLDEAGMLQVGPESAGAVPGPICYGRGGDRPTITDANLFLGRLDAARLWRGAGGPETLAALLTRAIGAGLGLDAEATAAAILRVANDRMAGAVRMVSLARGQDPRDLVLFAFGGAGPLHAAALARELGIPRVVIPPRPGLTNAVGCLVADLRHDFTRTVNQPLEQVRARELRAVLETQVEAGRQTIARERLPVDGLTVVHGADMQFRGQTHLLNVSLSLDALAPADLRAAFERAYLDRFGIELPELGAMLVNLRTSVIGRRRTPDLSGLTGTPAASLAEATIGTREVWFEGGRRPTPVIARERLPARAEVAGPAVLEQMDTTIVLEPGDTARCGPAGNLILAIGG